MKEEIMKKKGKSKAKKVVPGLDGAIGRKLFGKKKSKKR